MFQTTLTMVLKKSVSSDRHELIQLFQNGSTVGKYMYIVNWKGLKEYSVILTISFYCMNQKT